MPFAYGIAVYNRAIKTDPIYIRLAILAGNFQNKGLGFIWECEAAAAALNDLTRVSPPHRHSLLAGQAVPLYSPMIPLPAPHACLAPKLP